jgi:hypothetical protein
MPRIPRLAVGLALSVLLVNASVVGVAHAAPPTAVSAATMTTQKQIAIAKVKGLVTTFYTDAQLSLILDKLAENVYAGKPLEATFGTLFPAYALSASQTQAVATMTIGVQKDLGSAAALDKSYAAFIRNAQPYYTQISQKIVTMKRAGATKAACAAMVHQMVSAYLTKANVERALLDHKGSLSAKEWQSVRTHGGAMIRWSLYGL